MVPVFQLKWLNGHQRLTFFQKTTTNRRLFEISMNIPCRKQLSESAMKWSGLWMIGLMTMASVTGQSLYDFGNPDAEEQLHIELINRARANPPAEGERLAATTDPEILSAYAFFGVDLTMMRNEINALPAAPPLAPNAALTAAARGHSQWMLDNATQQHNQTDPYNTPAMRVSAAGYEYQKVGENIYAYSRSGEYGHAGFEVDWGYGSGGMIDGRGHRLNIHDVDFREIGVGVILGRNGNVGPQVVTQNFGVQGGSPTFATGVVYYDLNSNGFYDIGEGIAGLSVHVDGATHFCHTAAGGGWVVPVPATAATRTVTFSGLGIHHDVSLVIPQATNAKADLKLEYSPPWITSSATATADSAHTLVFQPVGGATAYHCAVSSMAPAADENCEDTGGIQTQTTGTYSVLNPRVYHEGAASFHLLNSTGHSQWLEIDRDLYGGGSPAISFHSRIRYATTSERFQVQVRAAGSDVWQTVDEQTGTDGPGQSGFLPRAAAVPQLAGKSFRVRFRLDFNVGSYFPNDTDIVGWFIDAIRFNDIFEIETLASQTVTGTTWSFTPGAGDHLVRVIPVISGREFPGATQMLHAEASSGSASSYESWAAGFESAHGLPAGTLADPLGDFDNDGRVNLIEYAFGGSPVSADDPPDRLPSSHFTATHLVLRYMIDTTLADVIVTPEACAVMDAWKSPGEAGAPAGFADQLISTDGHIETREASVSLGGASRCFLRLRVSRP